MYYTTSAFTNSLFERYAKWFEHVEVLANYRLATERDLRNIFDQNAVSCATLTLFEKSYSIDHLVRVAKEIEQAISRQDYVIARIPGIYGAIAIHYARKLDKPYLVEVIGCPWDNLWNHSCKGKLVAPFMYLITKTVIRKSPHVVYVSEYLQQKYPCKTDDIICSDVLLPPTNRRVLDERLLRIQQLDDGSPIILGTVGAVDVRYKQQRIVIEAMSRLNQEGHDFEYRVVGGGDQGYLRAIARKWRVEDKIRFLGVLPHEKVFQYLDSIDIYLQPSLAEGLGRALIEAMSRGLPTIGSDAGGIPELVSADFVFKRNDVDDLTNKLRLMTKSRMLQEAVRNFEKAASFESTSLDKRRDDFYIKFRDIGL